MLFWLIHYFNLFGHFEHKRYGAIKSHCYITQVVISRHCYLKISKIQ